MAMRWDAGGTAVGFGLTIDGRPLFQTARFAATERRSSDGHLKPSAKDDHVCSHESVWTSRRDREITEQTPAQVTPFSAPRTRNGWERSRAVFAAQSDWHSGDFDFLT